MKRFSVSALGLFLVAWAIPALADECAPIIQKTEVYQSSSTNLQIALLSMIDESDYDQAKRNIDATSISDSGMFSGNYGQFKERLSTYKSQLNFKYDDQETHSFATSYLPTNVSNQWVACEEIKSQDAIGFHAMLERADSNAVVVFYSWNDPRPSARLDSFRVRGAKTGWEHLPAKWISGTRLSVTYLRSSATDPFYLDASVGHLGQHVEVPAAALGEVKKISLGCGELQSNAIAAAVEAGQKDGRTDDTGWRSVPFNQVRVATNSNRAGAAVILDSRCDTTATTPTGASERVVLQSSTQASGPNDGAEWHAWARWSPSWKGNISLPESGPLSNYVVKVSYSDSNTNGGALSACKVQFAGKSDTLPNNGSRELSETLSTGDYTLNIDCDRPEVSSFNETITIQMDVQQKNIPVHATTSTK